MRDLTFGEGLSLVGGLLTTSRFLKRTPHWPRERMREWQFTRIQTLVTHAFEQVPFYRDLYTVAGFAPADLKRWEDFFQLPLVSKDQVIAAYPERMLAQGLRLEDLIVSRSSGSSGKVLDIAYGREAMTTYIFAGLRLYRMGFAYRPWHKQMYVYTSSYPLSSLLGAYRLVFVSTLMPIPELIARLRVEQPDLLVCYPSHLKALLVEADAADLAAIRPRCISVNSEMSAQAERDDMAARFGCPVLDEYSSEELTRIAAQCLRKRYHLFEDINYLETVNEGGRPCSGMGTIVGTNLHNFAMPMIRYIQNDLGEIEDATEACGCGWHFRTLRNLQGRRNDAFTLPSGKVLTSGFLLDATYEFLLEHRTAIRDFCLIQYAPERITLQVIATRDLTAAVEARIAERFGSFLEPGVEFKIERVAECLKTTTGKRNPILNLINRAGK